MKTSLVQLFYTLRSFYLWLPAFALGLCLAAQSVSAAPGDAAGVAQSAPNAYRILFVGDSITRHGTNADVKKQLGWDHVAGMAASGEDKDYAHLLAARIQAAMPDRKVEIYFASQIPAKEKPPHNDFRSGTFAATYASVLYKQDIHPHLVVIQLGEHEEKSESEAFMGEYYTKLITLFLQQTPRPQVICAGVWLPGTPVPNQNGYITGWSASIERVQREACAKLGVPFASVQAYALDPSCRGFGTSQGVQWHPSDKGHAGYATVLFAAYASAQKSAPVAP